MFVGINFVNGRGVIRRIGKAYAFLPMTLIVGGFVMMTGAAILGVALTILVIWILFLFVKGFAKGWRAEFNRKQAIRNGR